MRSSSWCAVDDDPADAHVERPTQLGVGLVVAVHHEPIRGNAGGQRHVQLAAGGDVEPQALGVDQSRHRAAQERLGRVDHPAVTEHGHRGATPGAEVVLVVHEQRRAELPGQVLDADAADEQTAVGGERRVVGQEGERERVHRSAQRGVGTTAVPGHIRDHASGSHRVRCGDARATPCAARSPPRPTPPATSGPDAGRRECPDGGSGSRGRSGAPIRRAPAPRSSPCAVPARGWPAPRPRRTCRGTAGSRARGRGSGASGRRCRAGARSMPRSAATRSSDRIRACAIWT